MIELSPRAAGLFEHARDGLGPSADDLVRVRARVLSIAVAPVVIAATPAAALPAAAKALIGGILVAAVTATSIAIVALHGDDAPSRPPVAEVAPTPAREVAPPPVIVALPRPPPVITPLAPAVVTAIAPPPARPVHRAPTVDDGLSREVALLRAARSALANGDTAAAIHAIADYRHQFAAGQLAEEAGLLLVQTACAAGDQPAAARARAEFLDRWPESADRDLAERPCQEAADAP